MKRFREIGFWIGITSVSALAAWQYTEVFGFCRADCRTYTVSIGAPSK